MKRLLFITLLIGYIYPCVAQDKPIRTEETLEETVIYKKTTTFKMCIRDRYIPDLKTSWNTAIPTALVIPIGWMMPL